MKPPFSLLVVYGDGSRVLRFSLPRWIVYGVLGFQAVVMTATAGLSSHYALLRSEVGDIAALRRRADDQRVVIDSFRTRVPAIREELAQWKALHTKMWKAVDPAISAPAADAEPPTAGVERPPADELELVATGIAEEGPRLRELARTVGRTGKLLTSLPLRWPVRGPVRSEFGRRLSPWTGRPEQHNGIDIGSPPGTPVQAPAAGIVVAASGGGGFGKHVKLDHGNGVKSVYGHLRAIDVKAGEQVEKGQVIGLVGSTGRSTGPHLHYQLSVAGKPVNPREFLSAR